MSQFSFQLIDFNIFHLHGIISDIEMNYIKEQGIKNDKNSI